MESSDDLKEIAGSPSLVADNDGSHAGIVDSPLIQPSSDVSRDPELPGFQNDNADAAGLAFLRLDDPVEPSLSDIEDKRLKRPGLWAELKSLVCEVFEIKP
ncbi:MAG: hypothetical protein WCC81_23845 [Pseudolabrys sp.]|jgi:hypothetical protein